MACEGVNMDRTRVIICVAAAFGAGVAAGQFADKLRIFGYRSYEDCMIHEIMKAGNNAQLLVHMVEGVCNKYPGE